MSRQPNRIYEFGPYLLDATERLLRRDGQAVPLQPKVFDLLLTLVERHGHLLEKDELMNAVWPDTVVEEANLSNNISILRKTLSDNGQQFIETEPKRGYRFVAPVQIQEEPQPPAAREISRQIKWMKRRPALAISMVILLLIGVVSAFSFWPAKRQTAASGAVIKSIAVLPFKPLNGNQEDEYLGIGIADSVITRLSGAEAVFALPHEDGADRRMLLRNRTSPGT